MADNTAAIQAASASPLIHYPWHGRDRAPAGYIKGMGAALAECCRLLKAGDRALLAITTPATGDPAHDVLDWYAPELKAAGAHLGEPADRLVAVSTILLGLGMRESSGRHCDGPDTPEDRGPPGHPVATTPDNAEAGLFQVSFDSIRKHADRQAVVDAYAGRNDLMSVFAEGAGCERPAHWPAEVGTGDAAAFQRQMKECPLFAVVYSALLSRQLRAEWGPINRKKVEAKPEAVSLFTQIRDLVDAE